MLINLLKTLKSECASVAEERKLAKELYVEFVYGEKYFDVEEFEKSPIKEVLKYDWLAANSLFKMGHVYTLVRHSAKAKDSPYGFSKAKEY